MTSLHEQFRQPRGAIGHLVGQLMALKNGKRSAWALGLLAPRPGEHVLEIGFGPGVDVRTLLESVGPKGRVSGVDASDIMLRQARARNQRAVRRGQVNLRLGDAGALPFGHNEFDAALSINCAQFWPNLSAGFRELMRVVRPAGRIVIAVQPMNRGAGLADAERWGAVLAATARETGWQDAIAQLGPTSPPVAAMSASKPEALANQ